MICEARSVYFNFQSEMCLNPPCKTLTCRKCKTVHLLLNTEILVFMTDRVSALTTYVETIRGIVSRAAVDCVITETAKWPWLIQLTSIAAAGEIERVRFRKEFSSIL